MQQTIKDHVKRICGIALSNTHCIPAMFTASMVISICTFGDFPLTAFSLTKPKFVSGGDLFMDPDEQKKMLDVLVRTDVELAWPTVSAQDYLRHSWYETT